jgi:putative tryptophan/tyrosine transport system substrate-binding protein
MERRLFLGGCFALALQSAAPAQQRARTYRIVVVHPSEPVANIGETGPSPIYRALFSELRRLGYVEGQNLSIDRRSAGGRADTFPEFSRELVALQPDLIIATSRRLVQSLSQATETIPIVASTDDPISAGLITSLARPGRNLTGVSVDAGLEIVSKRLELLREVLPGATSFAFLAPRLVWEQGSFSEDLQAAVRKIGSSVVGATLSGRIDEQEYRRAFELMRKENIQGVLVGDFGEALTSAPLIIELAIEHRVPAIYAFRLFTQAGGLMAYGVNLSESYRHLAQQADRVLKGEYPGDVPYLRPTNFELVLNRQAAKALGVELPPLLLARADEVIE